MSKESAIKEVDAILGNKRKFRMAMILVVTALLIIGAVLCVGFYTGEMSKIILGVFK